MRAHYHGVASGLLCVALKILERRVSSYLSGGLHSLVHLEPLEHQSYVVMLLNDKRIWFNFLSSSRLRGSEVFKGAVVCCGTLGTRFPLPPAVIHIVMSQLNTHRATGSEHATTFHPRSAD